MVICVAIYNMQDWGVKSCLASSGVFVNCSWQIAQKISKLSASSYGFSKCFGETYDLGRNRPIFAIVAQIGLFGTSLSRNCWILHKTLRKSHIPAQWQLSFYLYNLPDKS